MHLLLQRYMGAICTNLDIGMSTIIQLDPFSLSYFSHDIGAI